MFVRYLHNRLRKPSLRVDRLDESLIPISALHAVREGRVDRDRLPEIDLSVVTYNSADDLSAFLSSLLAQDYPLDRINLLLMRHAPCADEAAVIDGFASSHGGKLKGLRVECQENRGFGAGHNANFRLCAARYFVVCNADIVFFHDTLTRLVQFAEAARDGCVAVEARQFPFNHPKFYNPSTFETSWLVCCLALFVRAGYAAVGGFEERLFMYGEDVDLSLRLRQRGYRIAINPFAQVGHDVSRKRDRKLMVTGGLEATWLIRLSQNPFQALLYLHPRRLASLLEYLRLVGMRRGTGRLLGLGACALARYRARRRNRTSAIATTINGHEFEWRLPFETHLDELVEKQERGLPTDRRVTVSILIRVIAGRGDSFEFALRTALAQTYPNVEVVVLEDGTKEMQERVRRYQAAGLDVRYVSVAKVGRSQACNLLLALARGTHCIFLDDDDMLFLEHVETLVHDGIEPDRAFAAAWAVSMLSTNKNGRPFDHRFDLPTWYDEAFDPATMRLVNYFPIQSLLFSHLHALEAGRVNVELPFLEDWNFFAKLTNGRRGQVVTRVTSAFRLPASRRLRRRRARQHYSAYPGARADIDAFVAEQAVQPAPPQTTIRLLYHRVCPVADDPFALHVAPERFRRHLEVIANRADKDIVARHSAPHRAPLTVEIHFDDAYADIAPYVQACREFDLPVRVFATGYSFEPPRLLPADEYLLLLRKDFAATTAASRRAANGAASSLPPKDAALGEWYRFFGDLWKEEPAAARELLDSVGGMREPETEHDLLLMSPVELQSLASDGCLVGSHGASHVRLARRTFDFVADDAARIGGLVSRVDAVGARHFAFPFGGEPDFDATSVKAVGEAGFDHLYSCLGKDVDVGGTRVLGRFQVGNLDALNFAECFDRLAAAILSGRGFDAVRANHFLHDVVHVLEEAGA